MRGGDFENALQFEFSCYPKQLTHRKCARRHSAGESIKHVSTRITVDVIQNTVLLLQLEGWQKLLSNSEANPG